VASAGVKETILPRRPPDELPRLQRVKQSLPPAQKRLGEEMVSFFKNSVKKRHTKLGKIAEGWSQLVPGLLNDHCSLESFSRGTLVVIVDSSSHLYQLKTLLLAGLERQLLLACGSANLRKITLKSGRWYEGDEAGTRKVQFR
jgi:hypothetical protein